MPSPPFPPPTGEYSDHKANCHCGAVKFTFSISPPLANYPVVECNCSICQRNGYLLVYPIKENLRLEGGAEEVMGSYCFANNNVKHNFCKRCGSSVFFEVLRPPQDAAAEAEGKGEKLPIIVGVNLRMVTGLEVDKLIIKKIDGEGRGQRYFLRSSQSGGGIGGCHNDDVPGRYSCQPSNVSVVSLYTFAEVTRIRSTQSLGRLQPA